MPHSVSLFGMSAKNQINARGRQDAEGGLTVAASPGGSRNLTDAVVCEIVFVRKAKLR